MSAAGQMETVLGVHGIDQVAFRHFILSFVLTGRDSVSNVCLFSCNATNGIGVLVCSLSRLNC